MRSWLHHGRASASLAADSAHLWPAGALAELVSLGWVPFALTVMPLPTTGDLAFVGVAVALADSFPLNVVAIAAVLLGGLLLLRLVAAFAEATVLPALVGRATPRDLAAVTADGGSLLAVQGVALAPAAIALAAVLPVLVTEVPAAWRSPDLGGAPVLARAVAAAAPPLVPVLIAWLVGEAFAAAANRRVLRHADGFWSAVRMAVRDLVRRPVAVIRLTLTGAAIQLGYLVASLALLRVLWAPIAQGLESGRLFPSPGATLLLGFVFIWLCLVAASGALHVWLSAWWTAELGVALPVSVEEGRSRWTREPSSS